MTSTARALFEPENTQRLLMRMEAALARVQARHGIIPAAAAQAITASADPACVPAARVQAHRARVGHPLVALIEAWAERLEADAGQAADAAQWLHYGATTQDIYDTVQLQQLRQAADLVIGLLRDIESELMRLAGAHRATPMVGRTVGRHALPITFGLKVSGWMLESRRSLQRIQAWRAACDTGLLSGAVGSYAALGDDAFRLEAEVMAELGVGAPLAADWKGSRDMHADFAGLLALLAQSWRKVAQEIFLLQGDDIGELDDPGSPVGSSTMPHKANPGSSRAVIVLARRIPRHADVIREWMVTIHERDQISSADSLAELCIDTDDMLRAVLRMLRNLVVQPLQMRANLGRTRGQIMAEPAMFALGRHIGKKNAHAVVGRAARQARAAGLPLADALRAQPEVQPLLDRLALDALLDPAQYLGLAPQTVDRAIASVERLRAADHPVSPSLHSTETNPDER